MAKTKTEYDPKEIQEIIELYIEKELNGLVSKISQNGVFKFNTKISEMENLLNYKNENFKVYSRDFWSGTYKGEDNYGRAQILKYKKKNAVRVVGSAFDPDVLDIIALIDQYHKTPDTLVLKVRNMWDRIVKEKDASLKERNIYKEKYEELLKKHEEQTNAYHNLVFLSQSPKNSLNSMFKLSKNEDIFAFKELTKIFDEEERINELLGFEERTVIDVENVVPIDKNKASKKEKFKGL